MSADIQGQQHPRPQNPLNTFLFVVLLGVLATGAFAAGIYFTGGLNAAPTPTTKQAEAKKSDEKPAEDKPQNDLKQAVAESVAKGNVQGAPEEKPAPTEPRRAAVAGERKSTEPQTVVTENQATGVTLDTFQSVEGRFTVQMPGTPSEQTMRVAGTITKIYTIDTPEAAYAVAYADLPVYIGDPTRQQKGLDGARDGMLRNVGGQLTSETPIFLSGKYPGRELRANLPARKAKLLARIYLVDRRLYQIMVIGFPAAVRSPESSQFVTSLHVTSGPGASSGNTLFPSRPTPARRRSGTWPG
jgi:hypothetical protein